MLHMTHDAFRIVMSSMTFASQDRHAEHDLRRLATGEGHVAAAEPLEIDIDRREGRTCDHHDAAIDDRAKPSRADSECRRKVRQPTKVAIGQNGDESLKIECQLRAVLPDEGRRSAERNATLERRKVFVDIQCDKVRFGESVDGDV